MNVVSLFSGKISLLFALFKQLGVLFLTFNDLKWVIFFNYMFLCFIAFVRDLPKLGFNLQSVSCLHFTLTNFYPFFFLPK